MHRRGIGILTDRCPCKMTERAPRLFFLNNNKSCIPSFFKLMAHTVKLWERIIDHRIRQIVELDLVVVEKERNTGEVCRHNTGHTGYSDESENML